MKQEYAILGVRDQLVCVVQAHRCGLLFFAYTSITFEEALVLRFFRVVIVSFGFCIFVAFGVCFGGPFSQCYGCNSFFSCLLRIWCIFTQNFVENKICRFKKNCESPLRYISLSVSILRK